LRGSSRNEQEYAELYPASLAGSFLVQNNALRRQGLE
jgi:hypothetical protein